MDNLSDSLLCIYSRLGYTIGCVLYFFSSIANLLRDFGSYIYGCLFVVRYYILAGIERPLKILEIPTPYHLENLIRIRPIAL